MNAVPLEVPFALSGGSIETPEFTTILSIPYDVEIVFRTTQMPAEEIDCLIGTNVKSVEPCSGEPSILNVKWRLVDGNRPSTNGSSIDLYEADYSYHQIALNIGRFDSVTGGRYRLKVDVLQNATRLAGARPKLEVVPFLNPYDGRLLLAGLAFYVAIAAAVCGASLILVSAFR